MNYIIGIDAGTSNVKAVLFNTEGKEVYIESRKNEPIYIGHTHVEQNMNILWEKVAECIKGVVNKGPASPEEILGIGVTAQGEGIWLIDENGEPVQDTILWCDGRAADEVEAVMKSKEKLGEQIFKTTGTPPLTGTQLMLLKWMKNNRKEVLDNASTMFFCKDWVRYKLTGTINGDFSDTGTSLMDAEKGTVAEDLMSSLGLGEYVRLVAPPVSSDTIVGSVQDSVAEQLGLAPNTPVVAGAIDVIASAVGIGAVQDKDICVVLGTTCANEIFSKKENCVFGEPGTRYERHAVDGLFVNLLATMNGTPNLDWVQNEIALTKNFDEIDAIIDSVPAGSHGVIYHPYVGQAGERAPFYHPYAKANFFGIGANTKRADLIRAVYEGLTLSIKDCLQSADKKSKIFAAGGGTKSKIWMQMISDITGMEVIASDGNEFGAKGAAMMLGIAIGEYKDWEEAARRNCKAKCTYYPNSERTVIYEEVYKLYVKIREQMDALWYEREELMHKLEQ